MPQINPDSASIPHTAAWLGGFGLLPFVVGAVLSNITVTADFGHWFIIGYGAIILSFLGGIQWGVALSARRPGSVAYVVSIVISLVGWAATFLAPPIYAQPWRTNCHRPRRDAVSELSASGRIASYFITRCRIP